MTKSDEVVSVTTTWTVEDLNSIAEKKGHTLTFAQAREIARKASSLMEQAAVEAQWLVLESAVKRYLEE